MSPSCSSISRPSWISQEVSHLFTLTQLLHFLQLLSAFSSDDTDRKDFKPVETSHATFLIKVCFTWTWRWQLFLLCPSVTSRHYSAVLSFTVRHTFSSCETKTRCRSRSRWKRWQTIENKVNTIPHHKKVCHLSAISTETMTKYCNTQQASVSLLTGSQRN